MQLSIALPCYNEQANVDRTVEDVLRWLGRNDIDGEIVAVDDGSTDRTRARLESLAAREPRLRVVAHEVNQGYGRAVRSGLDACAGEWISFMDSDGQFEIEDLGRLLRHSAGVDVVVGRRFKRADPWFRRLNAAAFRALNRSVFGVCVDDVNCALKLIRRSAWPRIRPTLSTGALFNLELFFRMKATGTAWRQVDVAHHPRRAGSQTGARPFVILRAAWEVVLLRARLERPRRPAATARATDNPHAA